MAMSDIRARLESILLGTYGVEYPIPLAHFHLAPEDSDLDSHSLANLERAVDVQVSAERAPLLPVDRTAGVGYYNYPLVVQVGYVVTGAGDVWDASGEQSGAATVRAVSDRADTDRHMIESALGSWRNTGGLSPHIIDLVPTGGGGLELSPDRAILSVPFQLTLRVSL